MSIEKIKNAIRAPRLLYIVVRNINCQKAFLKAHILPELEKARSTADGSMDERDFTKITNYYGLAVPAVLGEAFCALRGRPMTKKERMACTCQGVITGLGDDYFDKKKLSNSELKKMIEDPGEFSGATAFEKLSLHFLRSALENSPDPRLMKARLERVYLAQVLSKKQSAHGLSKEEITDITLRKGADSLLFYRSVFSNPINKEEEKALYALGGLMQLGNDIFDLYEDLQQDIDTLITTAANISEVRTKFLSLLKLGYTAAYKTGYPAANAKKFIDIISISVFSRCMVCLNQLQKLETRSGNTFTPSKYKRKDLVCDMDTVGNIWRSVKFHIKYAK